jgi:outer membrane protein OmpA-like peptidoglycan-associated protein
MKNFLLAFFVFLIYSIFGMWYHACVIKEICTDENDNTEQNIVVDQNKDSQTEKEIPIIEPVKTEPSFVYKNGDLVFNFPRNLSLKSQSDEVIFPEGSESFKKSIFAFLNKQQTLELVITGLYNDEESKSNNQLGIKRADFVKGLLVDYGINANRITIESKESEFNFNANGIYEGGILFEFIDISAERRKAIESGIENKTLYSGFGSKEFSADKTLQAYALELKNYLDKYPNKKASIIGHTDSVGDLEANDWYGMERAKNVKQYLESLGIDSDRLIATSKGETEPIESNATLEGRRKNRRIEIKIN